MQLLALNTRHLELLPPERGTELLRHYARPGLMLKLGALAGDGADLALVVESLIARAHAAGPDGSARLLEAPRHEVRVSENVARTLYAIGAKEAHRLDATE